jgi:hypothetical protein
MIRLTATVLIVLSLTAQPASAWQAEVQRYYALVRSICQTGITPDLLAAYDAARVAVEKAQVGAGRDSNFWGLRTPEKSWLDCFQSPGHR